MCKRLCFCIAVLFLLSLFISPRIGFATDTYFYDDLGRLSRVIHPDDSVANYRYDAVGNLLGVFRTTGGLGSPTISEISPSQVEAGAT